MKNLQRIQALTEKLDGVKEQEARAVDHEVAEIVQLNQPDNIPDDVWHTIQENGRLATDRLNELLSSHRFHRLKASDQAKLIALAQDRAYGRADPGIKRTVKTVSHELNDETARALRDMNTRLTLPEYSRQTPTRDEDDPTYLPDQDGNENVI